MGRVGLARTQALMEGLKRELSMEGTTLEGASVGGKPKNVSGAGLQSGSVASPKAMVISFADGRRETIISLDLENLSGSNGTQGVVMGNPSGYAAYLYQHKNSINGVLYKVEVSCIEDIAGGAANADFDISGSTLGTYSHGDKPAGDPFTVFTMATSSISAGQTIVNTTTNSSNNAYMYLVNGTDGNHGGSAGQFTAGKLIFRFYGHKSF